MNLFQTIRDRIQGWFRKPTVEEYLQVIHKGEGDAGRMYIRRELSSLLSKEISYGCVYRGLEILERARLIVANKIPPEENAGRGATFYSLSDYGKAVLEGNTVELERIYNEQFEKFTKHSAEVKK